MDIKPKDMPKTVEEAELFVSLAVTAYVLAYINEYRDTGSQEAIIRGSVDALRLVLDAEIEKVAAHAKESL